MTRPTEAMRQAMAHAEVGDDVFGDDPTVRRLEERVAAELGKEAALFVPTGTMANQLAIRCQTRPGEEVVVEEFCHVFNAEAGAAAALSGVQLRPLPSERGVLDPARVAAAINPPTDDHWAPTSLVCVENTHNRHGGHVWPMEALSRLALTVRERGVRLHLDGARLWNAAEALGESASRLAAEADSVSVCFSKGLGCPVGSALAGGREFIREARRWRKRFGGGMRQAGILAAAALHALDHHRKRLREDHLRARRLVELADLPDDVRLPGGPPETNIVVIDLPERLSAGLVIERCRAGQVWILPFGPRLVRAVTHLDIDDEQLEQAGSCLRDALRATSGVAR